MAAITRKAVRSVILAAIVVLIIYFLWHVRSGLYPFIIAFLLAYILNPAVNYLEQRGLKRVWAIAFLYLVLFSVVILGGSYLIPLLVRELESFGRDLPQMTQKTEEIIQTMQWKYQNSALPHSLRVALDNGLAEIQGHVQELVDGAVNGIIAILTNFIGVAISPVLAFYLLHDWHQLEAELLGLLPGHWRHNAVQVLRDVDKVLAGVIRGQATVALIVGVLVSMGLYFLGVRYFLIIGILAGVLDVIPYFGAFIGATPAVTVALLESPWLSLKVVLLFFAIHQMEGTIIGPKIMGENVGLHPLSVIMFLFIGEELGGLVGMLLGVPVAAVGKVLFKHLMKAIV